MRFTLALFLAFAATVAVAQDAFRVIELEVLDSGDKPLQDATIEVATADMDFPLIVNKDGIATLNLPTDSAHLTLKASCSGHIPLEVRWMRENIPASFTFKMSRGEPIGGIVHDERGQPIEGVVVEGLLVSSRVAEDGTVLPKVGGELGTTDAQGRWRADIATEEPLELRLKLSHEKYFSDLSFGKRRVSNDELRSLEHVEVLDDRIPPQGTVTDAGGKPIAGASLYALDGVEPLVLENGKPTGNAPQPSAVSDADGNYQFPEPDGSFAVLCLADAGWAMVPSKRYEKNQPVDVKLIRWASVAGVLSEADKPCADEKLQLSVQDSEALGGTKYVVWNNYTTTNEKGEFQFDRLTNGYAVLGQRIEYCGNVDYKRQDFSSEFQTPLTAGTKVDLTCARTGNVVTGSLVPLRYDGSEAIIACGMIALEKEDEGVDLVKNIFFEWGKASTVGMQFDPVENAAWIGSRPKARYLCRVDVDGSFRIEHVPPGSYRARISLWCEQTEDAESSDETEAGWHAGNIWEAFPVKPKGAEKSVDLGLLEIEVYATEEE
jgi:hypothetical protein